MEWIGLFIRIFRERINFENSRNIGAIKFRSRYVGGMNEDTAAARLEALGHGTRLSVYRLLVKAGDDGLIVGDIQKALGVPASTLSHHLAKLARVGLVSQGRRGREICCGVDYDEMRTLIGFLTEECCTGVSLESEGSQGAA